MLPAYFVVFTLTLLLIGTTPVGTGAGVHQFDLLHPLFAHVHLVNGRLLTHQQMAQLQVTPESAQHAAGPAIGAGSGSVQADAGLGTSPTVPLPSTSALPAGFRIRLMGEPRLPLGRVEAPPERPPTSAVQVA